MDLNPVGTKTSDAKIPPFDLTSIGAKTSYPKILTLLMESPKRKEKAQKEFIPEDLESESSLSDSSSRESNSSNDSKYIESRRKLHDKNKKHRNRTEQESSD